MKPLRRRRSRSCLEGEVLEAARKVWRVAQRLLQQGINPQLGSSNQEVPSNLRTPSHRERRASSRTQITRMRRKTDSARLSRGSRACLIRSKLTLLLPEIPSWSSKN